MEWDRRSTPVPSARPRRRSGAIRLRGSGVTGWKDRGDCPGEVMLARAGPGRAGAGRGGPRRGGRWPRGQEILLPACRTPARTAATIVGFRPGTTSFGRAITAGECPVSHETMLKHPKSVGRLALIVLAASGLSSPAASQAPRTAYPEMAPAEQYRIANRQDEIALARSAAPPSISGDAEVLVLGRQGYETAVQGKNGFVCFV